MIDKLGRILCVHCNSAMRLYLMLPGFIRTNETEVTFKCTKCEYERVIILYKREPSLTA